MLTALDHSPALVLNADFRPLSYFPLSVWDWQDTIKAVVAKRVNVISEYDMEVRLPGLTYFFGIGWSVSIAMEPSRHMT